MTDPLIDRDVIDQIAQEAWEDGRSIADAVLDYLRSVLTPEALWPESFDWAYHEWPICGNPNPAIAADLHRRIFGDPR